jgi:hypothetical protein
LGPKWCHQVIAVAQDEARRHFMTNRPQAAGLVAEFLRDALAGGALGVPKLEVMTVLDTLFDRARVLPDCHRCPLLLVVYNLLAIHAVQGRPSHTAAVIGAPEWD